MRLSIFCLIALAILLSTVALASAQTVLIDKYNHNGSFEIFGDNTDPNLNPSLSGSDTRFATGSDTEDANVDNWSAIGFNGGLGGFDGIASRPAFDDNSMDDPRVVHPAFPDMGVGGPRYDSDPAMVANAQEYAFANSGSLMQYTSDPVPFASGIGDVFALSFYATIDDPGFSFSQASANYEVALIFDGGDPVTIGVFTDARSDDPDNPMTPSRQDDYGAYIKNTFQYVVTSSADDVAVQITLDNSNGGNDQPRFDAVSLTEIGGSYFPITVQDALDMAPQMFATPPTDGHGGLIGFSREEGDLTGDGLVNHDDYLAWRFAFFNQPSVTNVPEPNACLLYLSGMTIFFLQRRDKQF